ncbi:hypothetical protein [Chroococcidiopsis sp. CCMEE 29]|uniref:hypothetical protein n=1 Tax=Chroococcidiopsis sp. CCMEE 29 TaxID=155894 RepID=UPI0020203FE5|nr:hypothetical protein [Chroococcidiopsis sp. CCMEE 29]
MKKPRFNKSALVAGLVAWLVLAVLGLAGSYFLMRMFDEVPSAYDQIQQQLQQEQQQQ